MMILLNFRLSFMCRSNFDSQSGDFELDLCSLGALRRASTVDQESRWARLVKVVFGWTAVFTLAWWRRDGAVRLP